MSSAIPPPILISHVSLEDISYAGMSFQTIAATLTALVVGAVVGAFICGKQRHAFKIAAIGPGLLNVLFWGYRYFRTPLNEGPSNARSWLLIGLQVGLILGYSVSLLTLLLCWLASWMWECASMRVKR